MTALHEPYFSPLRVILSGQRSFGAAVLEMLAGIQSVEIVAVYAPEGDKLADRAEILHIPIHRSGTLRSDAMPQQCDLLIAAHSHDFVSRAVRNRLKLGAIGYHPSLLPRHRGRDAVIWTLKMRDPIAGGTVFWLSDTVDGGPIAAQEHCLVRPDDDAHTLWRRVLFPMGVRLLESVIHDILRGNLVMRDQDPALATWEPSLTCTPRLYRPELPLLGCLPVGFRVIK